MDTDFLNRLKKLQVKTPFLKYFPKISNYILLIKVRHFSKIFGSDSNFGINKVNFVIKISITDQKLSFYFFLIYLVPRERFLTYFTKWRLEQKWANIFEKFKS